MLAWAFVTQICCQVRRVPPLTQLLGILHQVSCSPCVCVCVWCVCACVRARSVTNVTVVVRPFCEHVDRLQLVRSPACVSFHHGRLHQY